MAAETSPLHRYNRRLYIGSVLLTALLLGAAAFLPFHYAGASLESQTALLLQTWGEYINSRAQSYAKEADAADTVEIALLHLVGEASPAAIRITVLAEPPSRRAATMWVEGGAKGFGLDEYLINERLPRRTIGDILYLEGEPHLIALLPGEGEDELKLLIGPSILSDFSHLQGESWTLAVIRGGTVRYSSESALKAGGELADRQLLDSLGQATQFETVQILRPDLLNGRFCAVAPLKDFDRWDVVGAYLLVRKQPLPHESPLAATLAFLSLLIVVGTFAFIGRRQLSIAGTASGGLKGPVAAASACITLSIIVFLVLGDWLSKDVRAIFAESTLQTAGGEKILAAGPDFFSSLEMLALIFLGLGALAISLLFLGIIRRFQHIGVMQQAVAAAGFLAPATVYLVVFTLGPILFALFISFHKWEVLNPNRYFVGLANYAELLGDPVFWTSMLNTLIYSLHVPLTMAIALALAMALHQRIRGVSILRTLFFLPYITSFVAISTVWQWLYNADFGLFNYLLSLFGVEPVAWLSDPATAMPAVMIMSVWIQLGYQMVIFIAGLQGIPQHLYEAATIDGAGPWTQFRRVTLPLLRPTVFFILATSIINSFQVFTYVYVMTQGGPLHSTEVLVYHIYKNAWEYFRMGYASAISWVLFLMILVVTLLQFTYFKRRLEEVTA